MGCCWLATLGTMYHEREGVGHNTHAADDTPSSCNVYSGSMAVCNANCELFAIAGAQILWLRRGVSIS